MDTTPEKVISDEYDSKLKIELEKRLKRPATPEEIINADFDSDLVNEVLWQLILNLQARIVELEKKSGIIKVN